MTKLTIDLDDYSKDDQELIKVILRKCNSCKFWSVDDIETTEDPIWKPKYLGDGYSPYYIVKDFGEHISYDYIGHGIDEKRYKIGNVFKTKEAAQRMADRRKRIGIFENKMMEFADGYEFDVGGSNYYVTYDNGGRVKEWFYNINTQQINPLLIYMTKEQAARAVDWANKHYPEGL